MRDIRQELHRQIDAINDDVFLKELNRILSSRLGKHSPITFTKSQLAAIAEGRAQVAAGQVYSHEEVMKEAEEWLKNQG